ncbi:hypothetical protein D3X11_02020 [Streptococcus sp. X16XC17]|uniref:hypothetical protein n=1 Tax=unclassified Streptococcus TaxID=2608887 RepID=UPI00066FC48F|nr:MULTISPECIES: hypothetical protein [unclassified Streptococcus]TCD46247.1 hypothetical protein D3X11_02020 [Streptococcus sp. X16XC17]
MSTEFIVIGMTFLTLYIVLVLVSFPFSQTSFREHLFSAKAGIRLNPKNRLGWLVYLLLLLVAVGLIFNLFLA